MKTKIIFIISAALFIAPVIKAQNMFIAAWEIGLPIENNNFLSKTSYSGGKVEYRGFVKDNLSIGGFINWRSYYEYFPTATYENPEKTQAVTTDMYRYIYNLPFGANVHYYLKGGEVIKPFVGIGVGAQYSEQTIYYNIYYTEEKNWGFLVRPEIGAILKIQDQWGVFLGASYALSSNQATRFGIRNLSDVNFSIGLAFRD